jgi:excisionase family DNA binding protein
VGNNNELKTVEEAAEYLRVKPATIRAWTLRRKLPFVKVFGRAVRIKLSDLQALIQAGTVPARPASRNGGI